MWKNMEMDQIIRYIACAVIMFTIFSVGSVYASNLTDIDTHWSKEYVEYLTDKGSINGYPDQTFKPDNTVTYGEAIKLIVASYNKNIENGTEHWASNYLEYAKKTNIIHENMFRDGDIDKEISRKEVIYMVYQSLTQYANKPVVNNDRTYIDLPFRDVKIDINNYGIDYIKAITECYYLGIVMGNDLGLMNPNEPVTRAEIATILTRAYAEEYRSYPSVDATYFLPKNESQYSRILAYMPNTFYEVGNTTWAKYIKNGAPVNYLTYYKDITEIAFNNVIQKSEKILNANFNVSYEMTETQWANWKEKILLANDVTEQQVDTYIQYVKDNEIALQGGVIMNPSTLGQFYISKNKDSLGIKGMIDYEILSNPKKVKYLTMSEYITEKKGVTSVKAPKYVLMYIEENEQTAEHPVKALYYLSYNLKGVSIY